MNIYKVGISNNLQEVGTSSQIRSFLQPFEYRGLNSFTNIGKAISRFTESNDSSND